jgi:hypothetical protein
VNGAPRVDPARKACVIADPCRLSAARRASWSRAVVHPETAGDRPTPCKLTG